MKKNYFLMMLVALLTLPMVYVNANGEKSSQQVPFNCDFLTQDEFNLWTVIDGNADGFMWKEDVSAKAAKYSSGSKVGDDWLISPSLKLEAGKKYVIKFDIRSQTVLTHSLKVYYGKDATIESQTINQLADYPKISNIFTTQTLIVSIAETADYNFGFYSYSADNTAGMFLTNVIVEEIFDNDLTALSVIGHTLPNANKEYSYTVNFKNNGVMTQSDYTVQLVDNAGKILGEVRETTPIANYETRSTVIKWAPKTVGNIDVKGRIVIVGEQKLSDNETEVITIDVHPAGEDEWAVIGSGTALSNEMPAKLFFKSSAVQTIYLENEIGFLDGGDGFSGMIKKIGYQYNNTNPTVTSRPMEVYMASTQLGELSTTVLAKEDMKLVFSGNVTFATGDNDLFIELTHPFVHTGGNLCVAVVCPLNSELIKFVKFPVTATGAVKRTRLFSSNTAEYKWLAAGSTSQSNIPNIKMYARTVPISGKVEGSITSNSQPVGGVTVTLLPLGLAVTTGENGKYTFDYVPEGTYSLSTSKLLFENAVTSNVVVTNYQTTVCNVNINEIAKFTVSGIVKDADGNCIKDAEIAISGYQNYNTKSDENGGFKIADVYKANGYTIGINKYGFVPYSEKIDVANSNVELPIILNNTPFIPMRVTAESSDVKVDLSWDRPSTNIYRYDDGIVSGQLGFTGLGGTNDIMGSVHVAPATLNSMSWWLTAEGGPHNKVNVFVMDLDEHGNPTSTALFRQLDVPNKDAQWSSFTFPEPLDCPRGFMIAVSYDGGLLGHLGIGIDTGKNPDWSFVEGRNYIAKDYTLGGYTDLASINYRKNFLIRAEGYPISSDKSITKVIMGDSTEKESQVNVNNRNLVTSTSFDPCTTDEHSIEKSSKAMLGYKVWRLLTTEQADETKWQLLTQSTITNMKYEDNNWATTDNGAYKYAVKTIYSNNNISAASLSNMVHKGMETTVTVNVKTNTPTNESAGAVVKLTNSDKNLEHIYTGKVDNMGKVIIDNVWKGAYTVSITLFGFIPIEAINVDLTSEVNTLDYTLTENIVNPFNLNVVGNEYPLERILTWDIFESIEDDFESHTDFTVNSAGRTGWSYIDVDQSKTYGLNNSQGEIAFFPNVASKMSYIVFNPSTTAPPLSSDNGWEAHSGKKYLACIAALKGDNNDWLISPHLDFKKTVTLEFWAKSITATLGLERFRVVYSTTGNAQSDFVNALSQGNYVQPPVKWTKYTYTVPADAKYFAINCVSSNAFMLMLDDIAIGISESKALKSYEVYLDGVKQADVNDLNYKFTGLSIGSHTAGVKAVYGSAVSEMTTIDFEVTGVAVAAAISGTVTDISGTGLSGVKVKISGDYTYETVTDASGVFNFPAVMAAAGYKATFSKEGLGNQTRAFEIVAGKDISFGVIVMGVDVTYSPKKIIAVEDGTNVNLTWVNGELEQNFRYDDGTPTQGLGGSNGTYKTIIGSVFKTATKLSSVSWFSISPILMQVNVFVFDITEDGMPTNTILYQQSNVENKRQEWNTLTLPTEIACPRGFYLAFSVASPMMGNVSIGLDTGISAEYPFTPNVSYFAADYTTGNFQNTNAQFPSNLMIRAVGYKNSAKENIALAPTYYRSNAVCTNSNTPYISQLASVEIETPIALKSEVKSESKALIGYKVWRFITADQANEMNWKELTPEPITGSSFTDNTWSSAMFGVYKYAIKAVYSGGIVSDTGFSNSLDNGMTSAVTINVNITGTTSKVAEARVKLVNNDGLETHIYSAITNETGEALFPAVYKGIYNVEIAASGYSTFARTDIDLSTDDTYNIDYAISEIIADPFNLQIVETGIVKERMFMWDGILSIQDGFEEHSDFTINSPGVHDWSYIDGDENLTYDIDNFIFPNAGKQMAYIVMNTAATNPILTGPWESHGGTKYLASFGAAQGTKVNNDWLISPELNFGKAVTMEFWAKSVTAEYGLERFKVSYSIGGKSIEDFRTVISEGDFVFAPIKWTKYTYTIPVNAKYVAITCISDDSFCFMLDDIFIGIPETKALTNYEVYLDGIKVAETAETNYKFDNLSIENHVAGVKAVYVTGGSQLKTIDFNVEPGIDKYYITYEQPSNGKLIVKSGTVDVPNGTLMPVGTPLTVTTTPNTGYELDKLTANDIDIVNNSITIDRAVTIAATFKKIKYVVTIQTSENGTLTANLGSTAINSGDLVEHGSSITIIATPDEGFLNENVYINGAALVGTKHTITAETIISARFRPVGVETIAAVSLKLYPNPVEDILNIEGEYSTLEIYNSAGKLIMTANGESTINLNHLTSGIYMIRAYNNAQCSTYKIIK